MKRIYFLYLLLFVFSCSNLMSQCSYNLIKLNHVDCFDDNTGEIQISVSNNSAIWWWTLPDGTNSTSSNLTNLEAGKYTIQIFDYLDPTDTNSTLICSLVDSIFIEQTIDITATFNLENMCSEDDSADVSTIVYGGTPPYSLLWTHSGGTTLNIENLPPRPFPYTLSIYDANGCQKNQYLNVRPVQRMQSFMSVENVICKDDNSGEARVFIENGTPPYHFVWNTDNEYYDIESSKIQGLYPGKYIVTITDTMGCSITDSINLEDNPKTCITIYNVFSPNEDGIHDFWEIENIHLYPDALVEIYDRMGNIVFRRRNYLNAKSIAFNGFSNQGKRLPSGTYYYILDLENSDEVLKGSLSIIR